MLENDDQSKTIEIENTRFLQKNSNAEKQLRRKKGEISLKRIDDLQTHSRTFLSLSMAANCEVEHDGSLFSFFKLML